MNTPVEDLPILYVTPGSPACEEASRFLDEHGIGHRRIDVSERPAGRAEMEKVSGQTSAPVLVWNGRVLVGFGQEELVSFLRSRDVKFEDS